MSTTKSTADQVDAIIKTAFERSDVIIAKKEVALQALKADIKAAKKARDAYLKKGDVKKAKEADEATKKAEKALDDAENTTDTNATAAAKKASKIADTAAETLRRELKVVGDNVADWGFGTEREDNGQVKALPGTWAHWVTDTVSAHQVTLHGPDGKSGLVKDVADANTAAQQALEAANAAKTAVEQAPVQNGPTRWGVWALCTALGGIIGLIAGYLFLMTGTPGFGPVTGLLLGLVIGIIAGYFIANMRTNKAQKKGEQ